MTDWTEEPLGIWYCKIGEAGVQTARGLDLPMRNAIAAAYKEITGRDNDFIFSGWCASLTESERAAVEDRLPDCDKVTVEITQSRLDALERDSKFLSALEAMGVDNWEGYSDAVRMDMGEDVE